MRQRSPSNGWDSKISICDTPCLRGDNGGGPAVVQDGPQRVVVERLVGNEGFERQARDQRLDADAVVTLAGEQDKARQIA